MNKTRYQVWPDGTQVRFTAEARTAMRSSPGITRPLRRPAAGATAVYTIDNTDDTLHDVILRETGERYGTYWLEAALPRSPHTTNQPPQQGDDQP